VPAPHVPEHILGLAALRSRPMTVIDCARSLELEAGPVQGGLQHAVVVEQDRHLYALAVDGIADVIATTSAPEPAPGKLAPGWERVCLGMVETPAGVLLLADVASLIAGPEKAVRLKEAVTHLRHA
jgi:purine-binding chemotaxis protein CheW